ncbi:MAG: Tetratricopeptide [Candidatus Levybacteria bacterium GW2011_GWA2_40_8]|nr:MAG: Tetratricopeptide [Candidatus Levybacteria bacterium GW2011_GWA2_40_8]
MPKITRDALLICLIIIVGAFFRFYNLNWDEGHSFHPDERNIAASVSRVRFPDKLDPEFFAYGSFPIYIYRTAGEVLLKVTKDTSWNYEWGNINLVGRFFSALFSTLTIPLIYILGRRLFNRYVGLFSAFFFSFCVGIIQTAHFAVTESILIFSVVSVTLLSLLILEHPTKKINYLLLGGLFGASLASKMSTISFLIIPLTSFFLTFNKRDYKHRFISIISFFALGILIFLILNPYTVLRFEKFLESMRYESSVVSGTLPVVYTLQFDKTFPYVFQIENFFWQMGILAGFSVAGMIVIFSEGIKNRNKKYILFSLFPILYFAYVGSWHTKFIRYMDPLLPFLSISAAFFLYLLIKNFKLLGKFLLLTVIFLTILWTIAFFSIYTRGQTRITASRWIYENINPGSNILTEHWDDGLPVTISSNNPGEYRTEQLAIYDEDNENKINYYADNLSQGDFIVINSRRLYATLIRLNDKYPITQRYYKLLFSGKLGYEKVAEFSSYPKVLGFEINDDRSEETFQVYDHPKVMIFGNTKRLDKDTIYQIIKND